MNTQSTQTWVKHLVECHCTLKLFIKERKDVVYHKFPVYSKIDQNGKIIKKLVKCNNCESLHEVYDISKSDFKRGKEDSLMINTIEDISLSLPERLSNTLMKFNCDISVWEHCLDVIEEERWGENVVLRREIIDEKHHVKILQILSENRFKILNKTINNIILLE